MPALGIQGGVHWQTRPQPDQRCSEQSEAPQPRQDPTSPLLRTEALRRRPHSGVSDPQAAFGSRPDHWGRNPEWRIDSAANL
eukprot:1168060-Prymnesium_polylepis.2